MCVRHLFFLLSLFLPHSVSHAVWYSNKHFHFKICSPMCVVCSFISVKNNTLVRFLHNIKNVKKKTPMKYLTCCDTFIISNGKKSFKSQHLCLHVFVEIQIIRKIKQNRLSMWKAYIFVFCVEFTYRQNKFEDNQNPFAVSVISMSLWTDQTRDNSSGFPCSDSMNLHFVPVTFTCFKPTKKVYTYILLAFFFIHSKLLAREKKITEHLQEIHVYTSRIETKKEIMAF